MITALQIEDHTRRGIGGLLTLLRRNRIRVEHRYCDSVSVRSIVYERRRGKISWSSIDRFVSLQRDRLLCPEGLCLPDEGGYRRFEGRELSRRMCENAALYLLRRAQPAPVRTVLIDEEGERTELCRYLTQETDSLLVITRSPQLCLREADRILEECGAVVRVASPDADIADADLVIAPAALRQDIRCAGDAVILSGEPPRVRQNAPVIYDYTFDLPDKFRSVKPPYLDDMYFAEALYSLAGAHELGSSVFRRCYDGRVLHTRVSLLEQLRLRLENRENLAAKS